MIERQQELQSLMKMRLWREDHARQVLAIWKQSSCSLRSFCQQHQIGYYRLLRWKMLLKGISISPEFVQVDVRFPSTPSHSSADKMEICLTNGRSIRIHPGFDEGALRRVMEIAEDIPCG